MNKYKIKISTTNNGKFHWLSFEYPNVFASVQIDRHIYCNLDKEINYAKKNNIEFSNLEEIEEYCEFYLKTNRSIFAEIQYQYELLRIEEDIKRRKEEKNLYIEKENNIKTYLMKDNHNGLYKIGFSKNPKYRESTLQSEKPSIKLIKIWDKNIESQLHKFYKDYRVRGEWFNLSKIQINYMCKNF